MIEPTSTETNVSGDTRVGVLLLTSSLERGGAERQVVALANGLDPDRFRVHVGSLSTQNPLASGLRDAGRFHIVEKRRKYDVGLIPRVVRLLRQLDISVIHSFLFDAEMVGRLAGRWAKVPAVICSNRCPHLHRARFKLWLARATAGCFDMMVANSWAGCEFERVHQKVDESRLRVIPNGVDTERFRPLDASIQRRDLGLAPNTTVVGMFGHFRGNKDHKTFLRAAARVCAEREDVVFLCVGKPDGEGPDSLFSAAQRLVQEHEIADRVLFLGERSDVVDLYNVCDVKVLASFFEGTANVLLEAMACGLPIVTTNSGDNARIVEDGRTGYVVDLGDVDELVDRILRLSRDRELRVRLGRCARNRAQSEFSVQALADKTGEIYWQVLRDKGALNGGCGRLVSEQ